MGHRPQQRRWRKSIHAKLALEKSNILLKWLVIVSAISLNLFYLIFCEFAYLLNRFSKSGTNLDPKAFV